MGSFKFELRQKVAVKISGEEGEVIARSESIAHQPQYLLRYKNNAGVADEVWWDEDCLMQPE